MFPPTSLRYSMASATFTISSAASRGGKVPSARRWRFARVRPAGPFRRLQNDGTAAGLRAGTIRKRLAELPGWKIAGIQLFASIDSSFGSPLVLTEGVHPGKSYWRNHGERESMSGDERDSPTHRGWGPVESRLVAESVELADPSPKLLVVQPDGQGVQLRP